MEIRVEWRSVKNKKVEVVNSGTQLGRKKPFHVFRQLLIAVLRMCPIPTLYVLKAKTGLELLTEPAGRL